MFFFNVGLAVPAMQINVVVVFRFFCTTAWNLNIILIHSLSFYILNLKGEKT